MYYYAYSIQHCWRVCKHCYIPLHIHLLGVGNGFAEPAFARQHALLSDEPNSSRTLPIAGSRLDCEA